MLTDMKVCSYAGDMNLNRKDGKKYVEVQTLDFLGNKTVKSFFLVKLFYSPMGYFPSIMF